MNPELTSIIGILISSACTIIVSVIQLQNTKAKKEAEKRDRINAEENKRYIETQKMLFTLVGSIFKLTYVTSLAVTGGHLNGNVKDAMDDADKAQKKFNKFMQDGFIDNTYSQLK